MDQCTFVIARRCWPLDWCAKHVLCLVGVQLLKFGLLPYIPIISFQEDPSSQFRWEHVVGHSLMDDCVVIVRVMQLIVIAITHTVQVVGDCLELIKMHLRDATGRVKIAIFLVSNGDSTFRHLLFPGLL